MKILEKEDFFDNVKFKEKYLPYGPDKIRIEKILNFIEGEGNKVLDIGCRDGYIGGLIKEKGNVVYGIDNSKEALERAAKRGIIVSLGNVEEGLPYENEFFDYIFAGEVIEHIYDTDFFLKEIYRVLKNKGYLVLTTPNLATLGRRILLLIGKNPLIEPSLSEPNSSGHIRYFIKSTLEKLLQKHNFKVIKFISDVVNFNNRGTFYSILLAKLWPTFGRSLIIKARKISL